VSVPASAAMMRGMHSLTLNSSQRAMVLWCVVARRGVAGWVRRASRSVEGGSPRPIASFRAAAEWGGACCQLPCLI
jgi:hypothetical protein